MIKDGIYMNRHNFDDLTIEKQIEYINEQLSTGVTVTNTCKSINIGRSTVRNRFKSVNYIYSSELNQYTSDNSKTNVLNNQVIDSKTSVTCSENNDLDKHDNNIETFVTNEKVIKNLIGLSNNYDKILEVIEWLENNNSKTSVIEVIQGIRIILPEEKDKEFRKTVRINDAVWEQFIKFCGIHKEFTQKDLQSQALLEFMDKYKK